MTDRAAAEAERKHLAALLDIAPSPKSLLDALQQFVADAVAQAVKEREEELALARAANTVLQVRYENERVLFCPEAHAVAPDGTDEPECPTCALLTEQAEEIARLEEIEAADTEEIERLRETLDKMWGEGQAVRDAIVKHYGTCHPPVGTMLGQPITDAERDRMISKGGP